MALGADPRDVIRMTMRQTLRAPLIGMAIGLTLALVLSRFLSSVLTSVSPTDPVTFGGVLITLLLIAGAAAAIPAARAARLEPASTLRGE